MKQLFLFLIILLIPFILLIFTNEAVRLMSDNKGGRINGVTSINFSIRSKDNCTWQCHNNTQFFKKEHVSVMKGYFNILDSIYFGIISILQSTGSYGLANIIILVIVIPFILCFFLTKSIYLQIEIRNIKRNARNY